MVSPALGTSQQIPQKCVSRQEKSLSSYVANGHLLGPYENLNLNHLLVLGPSPTGSLSPFYFTVWQFPKVCCLLLFVDKCHWKSKCFHFDFRLNIV